MFQRSEQQATSSVTRRRNTASATRSRSRTGHAARRPVVLMVEDDPDDRAIYGQALAHHGFDVIHANDYDSGLRLARERLPDAMLLDLGLPGSKTGLDLCLAIRRGHDTAYLPVVILSGFAAQRLGDAARAAGGTLYIEKPTSPLDVARAIDRLLASRA